MPEDRKCPNCGAELPNDSAGGECIQCLLALGLKQGLDPAATVRGPDAEGGIPSGADIISAGSKNACVRIGRYKLLHGQIPAVALLRSRRNRLALFGHLVRTTFISPHSLRRDWPMRSPKRSKNNSQKWKMDVRK